MTLNGARTYGPDSGARSHVMMLAVSLVGAVVMALLVPMSPAEATAATFTATNNAVDAVGDVDAEDLCLNGQTDPVNCNIYTSKQYVWLNGGPATAALGDGRYFFAVLEPGSQRDANDGSPGNLSDDIDTRADRTFSAAGGVITNEGTHDFAGNKIRLFDFTTSSNPGGVHILAICALPDGGGDANARDCKFDAFKVREAEEDPPPNTVNAIFQGAKYYDANGNGMFDGEEGIADWEINIYSVDADDTRTLVSGMPIETDTNGDFFFESEDVLEDTAEHFVVCEAQQSNWRQTGPVAIEDTDGLVEDAFEFAAGSASGGATVTAGGTGEEMCYDVTTDGSTTATASFLDFFNVPSVELSGAKYYDANEDGDRDSGELGIEGWPVSIESDGDEICRVETDSDGNWSSDDCTTPLLPGATYTAEEVLPATPTTWWQTGNLLAPADGTGGATNSLASFVYTVVLPAEPDPADEAIAQNGLDFGNACEVQERTLPGGRTKGFWTNKNGQGLLTHADFAFLSGLNLRNEQGGHQDFLGAETTAGLKAKKETLKSWLNDSKATNMAYMLSAQLAATTLSSRHGFTVATTVIDAAGTTVQDVMDAANTSLDTDNITTAAGTTRTYQEGLKDVLDKVNNQKTFSWMVTSPTACALPTTWAS